MIIVTGGAGFIGSAFVWKCNQEGIEDIIIVDNIATTDKWKNLPGLLYKDYIHKEDFLSQLLEGTFGDEIEAIVHMGACSATTEEDMDYLMENNFRYTQILGEYCLMKDIRFIYASSAATYGAGEHGFLDDHNNIRQLKPINRYGYSKQLFDLYALANGWLDHMVGLKFFNVYGPNEYHKNDMKSVVCKSHRQILDTGKIRLFKSHRPDYTDGGQKRDFIYVKDCVNVMWWLLNNKAVNGIFNVGTGQSRAWNDLAKSTFTALEKDVNIDYFDMPESIQAHYQYYTEANIDKLKQAGYPQEMTPLEAGIKDYVQNYLNSDTYLSIIHS